MAYVQTQSAETKPTGVLVIKVRPTVNGKWKKFPRKRFYLIKGSLEDNKALLEKVRQQPILTRECFYRNANASEPFISWLTSEDICESVYCRDIEEKFLSGSTAVPEFQEAYERSVKEYKSSELARHWLTTNLSNVVRDGFYRQKQAVLQALIKEAQAGDTTRVEAVMTDGSGTANFPDLTPGTYTLTTLYPIEFGGESILWTKYEVIIKAKKQTLLIWDKRDPTQNALPSCDAKKSTASTR